MNEQFVRIPSKARVRLQKLLSRRSGHFELDIAYLFREHRADFEHLADSDYQQILRRYLDVVYRHSVDPNETFSELGYLVHNRDVAVAVRNGEYHCGFHHWLETGMADDRAGGFKRCASGSLVWRSGGGHVGGPYFSALATFGVHDPNNITPGAAIFILRHCGLIDIERYLALYPDLDRSGLDPIEHYVSSGYREKRNIHPYFDDEYYRSINPELRSETIPILHYLFAGAGEGRNPSPLIDTADYCARFGLDLSKTNPLIHLNMTRSDGGLIERPAFDGQYYEARHPESKDFPGGSFHHFIQFGVKAGYNPSADFNTKLYYASHLNGDYRRNAYYHYLTIGRASGLPTAVPANVPTLARDVRRFSSPGPNFVELDTTLSRGKGRRGKVIAFYLPQFHAFRENDEWWGKGFTEWRNLARGIPRFAGHYQPRLPRDLSFYDLSDIDVMRKQVEMARAMGIWGFAFYFYWFNRHRLMETPLDAFLADSTIQMPFMLIWANENWTRRWDGAEHELLIKQDHDPEDDAALVDCFAKYFADPRYIRLNGQPFLVIYRADIIPDVQDTIARWKGLFRTRHGIDPIIYLAQTFGAEDPESYGFDGAIEFPPHKIGRTLQEINTRLHFYDWDFEGSVCSYSDAIRLSLGEQPPVYPLVKTVFPSWDNNARRQTNGMVFHGSTPELFGKWLDGALDYAEQNPVEGEALVFVNAWNEWCEGAYLEPDVHLGGAMLNALASVVATPKADSAGRFKVLLIGHDAFPAGAQRNLLAMAKVLQNTFGVEIQVVLLSNGSLLESYAEAVPTRVCGWDGLAECLRGLYDRGFRHTILNTVVTGAASRLAKDLGFRVVSLVHELPHVIEEHGLHTQARELALCADHVVFPTDFVRTAFVDHVDSIAGEIATLPQGIYHQFIRDRTTGESVRNALGIPHGSLIALNVGYGDLRKGVDIFCQVAHLCYDRGVDMHFVWVGDVHPALRSWLVDDLSRKGVRNLHFVGESDDVGSYMNAADVFFLASREDPFPSVVLEALQVGLPIVAFENNGGFTDLLSKDPRLGTLVPQADLGTLVSELMTSARYGCESELVAHRISYVQNDFNFDEYCFNLLTLLDTGLKKVSVVIPNYNYAHYLSARLSTVFNQTYPIYEIIVLDDDSTDGSLAELARIADATGRVFKIVSSPRNSGSAFGQWQRALDVARGEFLWMAEADDLAESNFVSRLVSEVSSLQGARFAFSDSRSIDEAGYKVYDSYVPYANSITPGLLETTRTFDCRDFAVGALSVANLVLNISSVIWRKDDLKRAFDEARKDLSGLQIAGDWRLYLATCVGRGSVAYVAEPLNVHRRHEASVTRSLTVTEHINEITQMHKLANKLLGRNSTLASRQRAYLNTVRKWLEE